MRPAGILAIGPGEERKTGLPFDVGTSVLGKASSSEKRVRVIAISGIWGVYAAFPALSSLYQSEYFSGPFRVSKIHAPFADPKPIYISVLSPRAILSVPVIDRTL
jgi:hypothetical protein